MKNPKVGKKKEQSGPQRTVEKFCYLINITEGPNS